MSPPYLGSLVGGRSSLLMKNDQYLTLVNTICPDVHEINQLNCSNDF